MPLPSGPSLAHGFHAVAAGDIACVVTCLEMRTPPAFLRRLTPEADVPVQLVRWADCAPEKYRLLFRRVGAPWLWWSRLTLDDTGLAAIIHDPRVQLHAVVDRARVEIGMVELDFRVEGECEIVFFGLIPGATGKGLGQWLMRRTLQMAWVPGVQRVWVHTCTLDDPRAVPIYEKQGFVPYSRQVEVFPDPRGAGLLENRFAPQHPFIAG